MNCEWVKRIDLKKCLCYSEVLYLVGCIQGKALMNTNWSHDFDNACTLREVVNVCVVSVVRCPWKDDVSSLRKVFVFWNVVPEVFIPILGSLASDCVLRALIFVIVCQLVVWCEFTGICTYITPSFWVGAEFSTSCCDPLLVTCELSSCFVCGTWSRVTL